jgi:D-alanyl-D-alanine-carboxypeptidase/D-alanyl-D-alanine-endopeptidase
MNSVTLLISFVTGAASLVACNTSDTSTTSIENFIQHKADSLQKAENLNGIFIGLLENGKKEYFGSGFAIPDTKTPFDSATIFEIGSISKTFTGYILECVLRNKGISDSSTVLSYLPDSVQANQALGNITFYSLLNHTSGLPRLPDNMDLMENIASPYDDYTAEKLYAYLKTCQPQPDGKSNYSNLGAGLAGVLAQRIAGRNYEDLLQQYIFGPFQITQHTDRSISTTSNKAQGYFQGNKTPYWFADVLAPAGGLKCSTVELLDYLQHMFDPIDDSSKQIIEKLLQPTLSANDRVSVCRSWHTYQVKNKPTIYWHNGGTYGFSTFAGFVQKEKKAVVIVINHFNQNRISDQLGFTILQHLMQ